MSCPPSPGRTPTGRATSATSPGSACPPTSSAGTCGWPATTCSWSAGPTSTARRSSSLADQEEVSPRELVDRYNRGHRRGPHRPRPAPTTSSPARRRQPLRRRAGAVHRRLAQRLHGRADHPAARSAVDRSHPARPLHRGHLPDLRLRRGPRRPVRQLRQPARPHRPHRAAQPDQRRDAGVRRDPALPPRPAGARRRPAGLARRARGVGHLAAQRHQVQPRTSSTTSARGR